MGDTLSSIIRVSGKSPFRRCSFGGPGIGYENTEIEPFLAVNPTTVGKGKEKVNYVGVWQEDRWSNGSAKGLVSAASFDGGKTWDHTPLPFSRCATPLSPFDRASDPWVTFGPDGTAYVSALCTNVNENQEITVSAIAAATSSDGGKTWRHVNIIKEDDGVGIVNDKEAITADPTTPGTAYIVWDRVTPERAPTWFSKTTNGGRTWSPPKIIFDPGPNNGTIGNQIVVDPNNGTLYNFFALTKTNGQKTLAYAAVQLSNNQGETWSEPVIISQMLGIGVVDSNTKAQIRSAGELLPEPTIDEKTGDLYVVWQDARFNGGNYDEVALSSSRDGGLTWSEPLRVNIATGKPAFTPMIRVNSKGVVGVAYFDLREQDPTNRTLPVNYWFAFSHNGGRTFDKEIKLTGPFDILKAPLEVPPATPGYFIGDYMGLITNEKTFISLFIQTTNDFENRTDAFIRMIDPKGTDRHK